MTKPAKRSKLDLTPTQNAIVRLRDVQGLTFEAIGEQIDMDKSNVYRAYNQAKSKLAKREQARLAGLGIGQDETDLRARADPLANVEDLRGAVQKYMPKVTDQALADAADQFIASGLYLLNHRPEALRTSTPKDMVGMIAKIGEMRQLWRGEPTQIHRLSDLAEIDRKLAEYHAEMVRRGMVIDLTPSEGASG